MIKSKNPRRKRRLLPPNSNRKLLRASPQLQRQKHSRLRLLRAKKQSSRPMQLQRGKKRKTVKQRLPRRLKETKLPIKMTQQGLERTKRLRLQRRNKRKRKKPKLFHRVRSRPWKRLPEKQMRRESMNSTPTVTWPRLCLTR